MALKTIREFDGDRYFLDTLRYSEEAAEEQATWLKERGNEVKIVKQEDGMYWLVYYKIGG